MSLNTWLKNNPNLIAGYSGMATVVALVATVGLLIVTTIQLNETKKAVIVAGTQLNEAKKALKLSVLYQIQRDNLDLISDISQDIEVFEYIRYFSPNKTYPDDVVRRANPAMHRMTNFFSAVFRQRQADLIDNDVWTTYSDSFCGFIKLPPVKAYWDRNVKGGAYGPQFIDLAEKC